MTSWSGLNGLTIQPVAPAARARALFIRAFGRQYQDRAVAVALACAQFLNETKPIKSRHIDIGNDQIDVVECQPFERGPAVDSLGDLEPMAAQGMQQQGAHAGAIVDGQNAGNLAHLIAIAFIASVGG